MLIFNDLFRLTKLFVQKGVSPFYLAELIFYMMPVMMVLALPMAGLVAILLALGRLSVDNEITAMKAHGVAFYQLMLPFLAISLILSLVNLMLMDYALPRANLAYASLRRDIQRHNPAFVLEEATVMKELQTEGKLWMYESTDAESGRLQNVKIWDSIWSGHPRFSQAAEATLAFEDGRATLTLYNGFTYEPTPENSDEFRVTKFQQQKLTLQVMEDLKRGEFQSQTPRSMSIAQLKTFVGSLRSSVQTSTNRDHMQQKLRFAEVEYHKKFSIPFACFSLGLIGIPLGMMVKQSGKMIGLGIGLAVIVVYYLLLQAGQTAGVDDILPPMFAMWLPNLVIAIFGILLSVSMIGEGKILAWRDPDRKLPIVVNRTAGS